MIATRREILTAGGVILAGLAGSSFAVLAQEPALIRMAGTANGSAVWFDPIGLRIAPGATVRWINADRGNSHTTTAYHPDYGKPARLPAAALPWDSAYLLPDQTFDVTFVEPGVYDYFCRPHEHAGMVGRIVVLPPGATLVDPPAYPADGMPAAALAALPSIADIVTMGAVAAPLR